MMMPAIQRRSISSKTRLMTHISKTFSVSFENNRILATCLKELAWDGMRKGLGPIKRYLQRIF